MSDARGSAFCPTVAERPPLWSSDKDTLYGILCLYRANREALIESETTMWWSRIFWEAEQALRSIAFLGATNLSFCPRVLIRAGW